MTSTDNQDQEQAVAARMPTREQLAVALCFIGECPLRDKKCSFDCSFGRIARLYEQADAVIALFCEASAVAAITPDAAIERGARANYVERVRQEFSIEPGQSTALGLRTLTYDELPEAWKESERAMVRSVLAAVAEATPETAVGFTNDPAARLNYLERIRQEFRAVFADEATPETPATERTVMQDSPKKMGQPPQHNDQPHSAQSSGGAELDRLHKRIAELESALKPFTGALKPFADLASDYEDRPGQINYAKDIWLLTDSARLTVADVHRARKLLAEGKE